MTNFRAAYSLWREVKEIDDQFGGLTGYMQVLKDDEAYLRKTTNAFRPNAYYWSIALLNEARWYARLLRFALGGPNPHE